MRSMNILTAVFVAYLLIGVIMTIRDPWSGWPALATGTCMVTLAYMNRRRRGK